MVLETIEKYKEYLDYIAEHYNNVQKAWAEIKEKCFGSGVLGSKEAVKILDSRIKLHDLSKLSTHEFVPYAMKFFPVNDDVKNHSMTKASFGLAWENHKVNNPHHWQTWTQLPYRDDRAFGFIEMVVDWHAMGMKFGDTARDYYGKNIDEIDIPRWAKEKLPIIFSLLYDQVDKK